jgi:Tfp pilus assembly PilM family ATPase
LPSLLKQSHAVGIHLQDQEICLIHLRQYHKNIQLIHSASVGIAKGCVVDGVIKQYTPVAKALTELVERAEVSNKSVVLSVPWSQMITQEIVLHKQVKPSRYRQAGAAYLTAVSPELMQTMQFDFMALETGADAPTKLLAIGCKKSLVNLHAAIASQAQVRLSILDIDLYAVVRLVYWLRAEPNSKLETLGVVLVVESATHLVIASHYQPLFHRCWLTLSDEQLGAAMTDALKEFASRYPSLTLPTIYIIGDRDLMSDADLPIEVAIVNPLQALSPNLSTKFLVSLALAMRGLRAC